MTDLDCPGRDGSGRNGTGLLVDGAVNVGVKEVLMDSYLLSSLGRSLFDLEEHAGLLDDLMIPRQVPSGENGGKTVSVKKSKVPLSVAILDLKIECENTLGRWIAAVHAVDEAAGVRDCGVTLSEKSRFLQQHLFVIDESPWGQRCAEEIIAQAKMVSDVVAPPAVASDPEPITHGTVRQVLGWVRLAGHQVSRSTVQRWVSEGKIPSVLQPDGRIFVAVADVVDQARQRDLTGGPPRKVS